MSDTTNTGATTTEAGETVDTTTATGQQQDTQTAQAGETKPAAGTDEKATAGESTMPAIEVKLPEGVKVDEGLLDKLKGTAKDSESAQALVDAFLADQKRAAETWEQTRAGWKKELEQIKDFDTAGVKRALDRFGSPELVKFLDDSGLGDHPELAKLFDRIGKATKDDSIAGTTGGGGGHDTDSRDARLRRAYPSEYKE